MKTCIAFVLAIAGAIAPCRDAGGADAGSAAALPAVAQWSRFEASYVPDAPPTNPFDPDEIDVRAEFGRDGSGTTQEVGAFWYQGYERALVNGRERLTAVGDPHFRVRFTPTRPGRHRWRWVVRTAAGTVRHDWQRFDVTPAQDHGFLRVSRRDPRHLAFDDGSPYFAVGENTGWYDARGTFAYDDWFGALAEQGANWGRLWMASFAFGIEWSDTGLGDYTARLGRAWQLDYVLEEAERRDIQVMLVLLTHGAFSLFFNSEWANNPYNAANGGPLVDPQDFFTDPEARRLFERRLRYVVARWGWSTHLMAWELWNEVELVTPYVSGPVTSWHAAMAAELRALDPYDHMVTTSHAFYPFDPNVWNRAGLDFTQIHLYTDIFTDLRDVSAAVTTLTADRLAATVGPVLFAELGVDSRGPGETRAADPGGVGVHDGLWGGVVSGGIGTGMTWWWDNLIALEPDLYYPMFGAVARFVDGVRWDRERFRPADATVESATRPVRAHGLKGRRTLLVWLKDAAYQWYSPGEMPVEDATLEVPGRWCGRWYDTWTGAWLEEVTFRNRVPVPPFSRDVALLAHHRCR
jgi:hypothetical protein